MKKLLQAMTAVVFLCFSGFAALAAELPYPPSSSYLTNGQYITHGGGRISKNGAFRLVFQADGNLVTYRTRDNAATWASGTAGSGASLFTFCLSGNGSSAPSTIEACLFRPNRVSPIWRSYGLGRFISSDHTTYLDMQDDGNLVLSQIEYGGWKSNTVATNLGGETALIPPGTRLDIGATYLASGGRYRLTFQSNGNLVVTHDGVVKWSSGTANRGATFAIMQMDGNFVIYSAQNRPLWATGTYHRPNSYLALQTDGNLVLYQAKPVWDSWGYTGQ